MRTLALVVAGFLGAGCATTSGERGTAAPLDCRGSCASRADTCRSRNSGDSKGDGFNSQSATANDKSGSACTAELQACIGSCPAGV
jgi:hypothetical protein